MVTELVKPSLFRWSNYAHPKKGGIMKRQILSITLFSLLLSGVNLSAQSRVVYEVSYGDVTPNRYAKKDIREFRAFQRDVDRFTKAVQKEQVRKAKKIKRDILHQMRNEIQDTRQKIKFVKRNSKSDYGLRNKKDRYSKRHSNAYLSSRDLRQLNRRLENQIEILFKLENLYLNKSYRFYKQARKHESLMYDFERTLKADINHSFKDYRNRYRNG